MAFTTIYSSLASILRNKHKRLDAKYFAVREFFHGIAERHSLEVFSLEQLCSEIVSGSYVAGYTSPDKGIPYIRVGDIKPFVLDEYEEDLAFIAPEENEDILTKQHDILIARTQATTDKLGTAAIVDEHTEGWATSQHVTRIVVKPNKISPYYVAAYCNSKFFKAQTSLASQGDTRVEFTHSQIGEVQIIRLESEHYNRIVADVQNAVQKNRRATRLLNEAKQELLSALRLPPVLQPVQQRKHKHFSVSVRDIMAFDIWNASSHTPFLLGLERHIANTFPTVPLGAISDIQKGDEVGSALYDTYLNKQPDDYAFIRTSDILNHEIDLFPDYFIRESVGSAVEQDVQPLDILFTKDGKIGQVAMVTAEDRIIVASGIVRIRLYSKASLKKIIMEKNLGEAAHYLTPEYLFTVLAVRETGYFPARRRTVVGTTIPHLREERLAQLPIPILSQESTESISSKVRQAFIDKAERKRLILNTLHTIDSAYQSYIQS